jgi:hypothetical protein
MAFTPWTPADIQAGKPTKEEIFQLIKGNQESFNTDIEALKQTARFDVFDVKYSGSVDQYSAAELDSLAPTFKAPVGATMVSFIVTLLEASTSGNLEISLEKSIDNGINWSPLLNNPVTVSTATVGSISGTVDWLDVPSQSFAENDLLKLVVDGIQVGQGAFHVSIYAEVA